MYTHPEFHHIDADIKAEELTNVQIMNILNPATEEYKDYINFIYDSSSKLALLFLGIVATKTTNLRVASVLLSF
jgi:hypothetical protein